jgi:hypothetical protein
MNHNPIGLLIKTYPFLLLRFLCGAAALVPGYFAIKWGIDAGRELTGVNLLLTDFLFAYIGIAAFIMYIEFVRKAMLHMISYAHVGSMTGYIAGRKGREYGVGFGFKLMLSRFGSVSAMFVANKIMRKVVGDVSSWIADNDKFIPAYLKKGFIGRMVKGTVEVIVFRVMEVIVSYLYINKDTGLWQGVLQGASLYIQSWKLVFKNSFLATLWVKLFSVVLNFIALLTFVWVMWGSSLLDIAVMFIFYKIVAALARMSLLEPYQTAYMLIAFHKSMKAIEVDEEIADRVDSVYDQFKDVLFKRNAEGGELAEQLISVFKDKFDAGDESAFSKATQVISSFTKTKRSDEV